MSVFKEVLGVFLSIIILLGLGWALVYIFDSSDNGDVFLNCCNGTPCKEVYYDSGTGLCSSNVCDNITSFSGVNQNCSWKANTTKSI